MVTTESLVDSLMPRWLPVNFPIQASPSLGFLWLSDLCADVR
jgi:hypothetical protein